MIWPTFSDSRILVFKRGPGDTQCLWTVSAHMLVRYHGILRCKIESILQTIYGRWGQVSPAQTGLRGCQSRFDWAVRLDWHPWVRPASLLTPSLGREAFSRAGPRAVLRTACIPLGLALLSFSFPHWRAGNEERQTICFKVLLPSHAACSQASHTIDWSRLRAGGQAEGGRCIALHRYQLGQPLWPECAGRAS